MIQHQDKFGKWTVIHRDPVNDRNWMCICDCGTEKSVSKYSLKNGDSTSCGCSRIHVSPGDIFGKLTIMDRTDNSDEGNTRWLCHCECGNDTIVHGSSLSKGMTKSCGCLSRTNGHRSSNETLVSIALETLGIPFEYEETRFDLKKGTYTPDFFLPTMNLWIEVKSGRYSCLMKAAEFALDHDLLILTDEDQSSICGGKSIFYLYIRGRDDMDEVRDQIEEALSDDTNREASLLILTRWKECTRTVIETRLSTLEKEESSLKRLLEETS